MGMQKLRTRGRWGEGLWREGLHPKIAEGKRDSNAGGSVETKCRGRQTPVLQGGGWGSQGSQGVGRGSPRHRVGGFCSEVQDGS